MMPIIKSQKLLSNTSPLLFKFQTDAHMWSIHKEAVFQQDNIYLIHQKEILKINSSPHSIWKAKSFQQANKYLNLRSKSPSSLSFKATHFSDDLNLEAFEDNSISFPFDESQTNKNIAGEVHQLTLISINFCLVNF